MYTVKLYSSNRCFISNANECRSHTWNCNAFTGSLLLAMQRHCTSSRAHKGTAANFVTTILLIFDLLFSKNAQWTLTHDISFRVLDWHTLLKYLLSQESKPLQSHTGHWSIFQCLSIWCNFVTTGWLAPMFHSNSHLSPHRLYPPFWKLPCQGDWILVPFLRDVPTVPAGVGPGAVRRGYRVACVGVCEFYTLSLILKKSGSHQEKNSLTG